jgi:hypothetical protein
MDIDPNDDAQITQRITAILIGHPLWPGGNLRPPTLVRDVGNNIITATSREFRSPSLPLGRIRWPDGRQGTVHDEMAAHAFIREGESILERDGATMTATMRRRYRVALTTLEAFIEPGERGRRAPGRNPAWPVSGDPQRLVDVYERLVAFFRRRDRARPLPDVWRASPEGFTRLDSRGRIRSMGPAEIARRLLAVARGLNNTSGHEAVKRLIRQAAVCPVLVASPKLSTILHMDASGYRNHVVVQ